MKETDLDNLVRMAVELDEFERAARFPETAGAHDAVSTRIERPRRLRPVWRIGVSAAAAAALLLVLFPPATEHTTVVARPPVEIEYWPGIRNQDGLRVDCFEPSVSTQCAVLAVFHRWQKECQCLEWQLYEWEDGRPLAELSPDDVRDITLDVTEAPPVEQLLVVVIAKNASDLPRDAAQVFDLLHCLHEVTPPACAQTSTVACASALRTCLPAGVTVVPQSFLVE